MLYTASILILASIYVILASSYNLLVGQAGIFSVAHAAFFGVGAYAAGIMSVRYHADFSEATLVAMAAAGILSAVVGAPAIRLSGDFLMITSFGFQIIITSVIINATGLTGGSIGLIAIPRPSYFGYDFPGLYSYLAFAGGIAAVAFFIVWRLASSPFGRSLRAVREDEVAAAALGKRTVRLKILAFAVAGVFAGLAGSLYAHYISYINPEDFTIDVSILILLMVTVGGLGSVLGSAIGAIFLIALPSVLKLVNIQSTSIGFIEQIMYGGILLVFVFLRPQGILGGGGARLRLWRFANRRGGGEGPPSGEPLGVGGSSRVAGSE